LIEIGKKIGIPWFANDVPQTPSPFNPLHTQNLTSQPQFRASLYSSSPQMPKPFPLPKFWLL